MTATTRAVAATTVTNFAVVQRTAQVLAANADVLEPHLARDVDALKRIDGGYTGHQKCDHHRCYRARTLHCSEYDPPAVTEDQHAGGGPKFMVNISINARVALHGR